MIYFQTKWFLFQEQLHTFRSFYRSPRFALADLLIALSSLFLNPYRACRKHFEARGGEGVYGETPLSLFQQIAEAASLGPCDLYVELGSGRGKSSLWAAAFRGCHVLGIECVPSFISLSRFAARFSRLPARFECASLFDADLSRATVVYLSMIHLAGEGELLSTLLKMPIGSRLVTISEPIKGGPFHLLSRLPARFPWGESEVFIHVRTDFVPQPL